MKAKAKKTPKETKGSGTKSGRAESPTPPRALDSDTLDQAKGATDPRKEYSRKLSDHTLQQMRTMSLSGSASGSLVTILARDTANRAANTGGYVSKFARKVVGTSSSATRQNDLYRSK